MSTDPKSLTDEALLADGRPFVRCGCGFLSIGQSEIQNRAALDNHSCPYGEDAAPSSWVGHVFSFWGMVIIAVIASAVLAGMGVKW